MYVNSAALQIWANCGKKIKVLQCNNSIIWYFSDTDIITLVPQLKSIMWPIPKYLTSTWIPHKPLSQRSANDSVPHVLCGSQARIAFYTFTWVEAIRRRMLWRMKIRHNSNFVSINEGQKWDISHTHSPTGCLWGCCWGEDLAVNGKVHKA